MDTIEQPLQKQEQPTPPNPPPHPQAQPPRTQLSQHLSSSLSFSTPLSLDDDDVSRSALTAYRAKEEEIEKRRMDVKERIMSQLTRVEEESKRLALIREELETLSDPMGKEVTAVRKKIDAISKDLKFLGQICQKKEREYKEALDAFNEKNKEKAGLANRLTELTAESEKLRMKKLEELSKSMESLQ
ncbi:hypothetical protein SAY87_008967 [Trapa incisa]|uniref:RAB6-interacting golgin n=1 Tax=Trapa incisa TaxID=236973 RepID=A0AAN7Q1Q9_9MYRT|nr:hypothetical protein SAY87_008967 [Trapa incisa]